MAMNPFTAHLRAEFTDQIHAEIAAEQVRQIDLSEYAIGSPRYERLVTAMELSHQFEWPNSWVDNA